MQAFSILSEPTVLFAWCMSTSSFDESSRWNSRRTLGGKEKKGGAGVTATPHYSASADWLHFTCSTSKSQITNLLFTRSPLWHEGTNLPGHRNSRCVVYLELAMFHLLLTLGDIYTSQAGLYSMVHATSAVFFDVCKNTGIYGTVRCDRTVCRMDFHSILMLAFN